MKVITTNLLNRFWANGVKPIKEALAEKLDASKVANNRTTTASGYTLDARQGKEIQEEIDTLNSRMTWKLAGTATGNTIIAFPADAEELIIKVIPQGNTTVCINIHIPVIAISAGEEYQGGYAQSSNVHGRAGVIFQSVTSCKLNKCLLNGTDVEASSQIYVFYR